MMFFLVIWILLVGAAGCLAVGALWGRELAKGSCGHHADCARARIACEGCTSTTQVRPKASGHAENP